MIRLVLSISLTLLASVCVADSPLESAHQRVQQTFAQRPSAEFVVDAEVLNSAWQSPPFDQNPYIYTFAEIEANWDRFMRGLRIPFPSPEYLRDRYHRFPQLMHTLAHQDADWEAHSLNVLEVWQAYFRGDFERSYRLGIKYGGYALVPAIYGEILQGVYLARSNREKQVFLQDAIDRIQEISELMPVLPSDEALSPEYVLLRLGYAYAVARLAEDAAVAKVVTAGLGPSVINAATEALAVDPDHPLTLALNAAFDANVIRRVGKGVGRLTFGAQPINAEEDFALALNSVDDMAIVRYEYANSLLYLEKGAGIEAALDQLRQASTLSSSYSMEALDVLYARKRLEEVRAWQASGMSFGRFDRKRRRFMQRSGENLYSVVSSPYLVH
jgi:hypothetical protein